MLNHCSLVQQEALAVPPHGGGARGMRDVSPPLHMVAEGLNVSEQNRTQSACRCKQIVVHVIGDEWMSSRTARDRSTMRSVNILVRTTAGESDVQAV